MKAVLPAVRAGGSGTNKGVSGPAGLPHAGKESTRGGTEMEAIAVTQRPAKARERLVEAAYRLFSRQGIGRVGVDRIVAESGCVKSSLYNNFRSKEELALAFLERREELWTRGWLEAEINSRASSASARLLAIFDLFDDWFHSDEFEGCSFVNVMLESESGSRIRREAARQLAKIRSIVQDLAEEARLADAAAFAQAWHMLMKGSIVTAGEGNAEAARQAKRAARLVLEQWPRAT